MKNCFKCGEVKPITEFYKHPKMTDGHLGKCKSCTRADSEIRRKIKEKDLEWQEKEMARHREKSRVFRMTAGIAGPKRSNDAVKKWDSQNPEKKYAHGKVARAIKSGRISKNPCEVCGDIDSEAHHEDCSKPLQVMWLCPKHHGERHVEIRRLERFTNYQTSKQ